MNSVNRAALYAAKAALFVGLMLLWQFGSTLGHLDFFISAPGAIGASFWSLLKFGDFVFHASSRQSKPRSGIEAG